MHTLKEKLKTKVTLLTVGLLLTSAQASWAKSDMELQEEALKAREIRSHETMDHSTHQPTEDSTGGFRGVFYGYLPCDKEDCDGIKQTLSLKPRNNYLLVTQYTKEFSMREHYEKGKYDWDEKSRLLTLKPNKEGAETRLLSIQDQGSVVVLDSTGKPMPGNQEAYTLSRSDKAKNRQIHIH